ncbi:MFS transporter [Bythopirellula polymerisocia]|uniref:Putative MFS-type transporter YhjX n=1 Tax=Bythopirellula polymerisocia TaxID=2528003 RepID=A0A5C6CMB5_9BACT|nr:MFS transporter [Bythopirellula polymerisocia]TWU24707.1 putative MFS-type transporter YhjX [Bythopirellula polymerisocia]
MSTPSAETAELLSAATQSAVSIREPLAGQQETSFPIFYGWVILPLAIAMMLATSPGQTFGVSYFNDQFIAEFGLSNTALASTYLVATLLAALSLTSIGSLIDRFGIRRMSIVGFLTMAGACVFASQASGLVTLFISFLLLRMFGPGTMTLLANNTLAAWFDRRLGLVSSIAQVSMAGAWGLVPVAIVGLIDAVGWRGTYLVFAAIMVGGFLPLVALFLRQSPREIGQVPDGLRFHAAKKHKSFSYGNELTLRETTQHRAYWILLISTAVWSLVGTGLVFHLVAVFRARGFTAQDSTVAVSSVALAMAATQIVGGVLADRLAMRWLLVTAMALIGLGCVVLATAADIQSLILGYGTYGCGQGIKSVIAGTAWARYFGRTHLGKIRGTSLTAAVGASAVGPVVMGVSVDYLGGFTPSMWLFAAMAGACAVAGFWATPPMAAQSQA